MYAGMLRVRLFEERVRELFANGRIPAFPHTSVGQEATAVGAGPSIPIPFSPPLEAFATPKADDVVGAVRQVLE
jgi:hypothetical protein